MNQVKRLSTGLALLLITGLALSGCNKPTAEMKKAQQAIDEAKKAGADKYAAAELASAEKSLTQGKTDMDSLRYRKAREKFDQAYQQAVAARDKAAGANRSWTETKTPDKNTPVMAGGLPDSHTVYAGECLWRISEYKDIYADPYQWPIIYDANRNDIDARAKKSGLPAGNPDGYAHWIFPGEKMAIPRNASLDDIKAARKKAGAPTPYMPPGK